MTHKFVIELTDDCKGYEQDADYLERVYGAEPIKEHDEEIYNKAIDDFKSRLEERILAGKMIDEKFAYIDNCDIDEIAEQLKVGGENETDKS